MSDDRVKASLMDKIVTIADGLMGEYQVVLPVRLLQEIKEELRDCAHLKSFVSGGSAVAATEQLAYRQFEIIERILGGGNRQEQFVADTDNDVQDNSGDE